MASTKDWIFIRLNNSKTATILGDSSKNLRMNMFESMHNRETDLTARSVPKFPWLPKVFRNFFQKLNLVVGISMSFFLFLKMESGRKGFPKSLRFKFSGLSQTKSRAKVVSCVLVMFPVHAFQIFQSSAVQRARCFRTGPPL